MPDYKLTDVRYFGKSHTYELLIDGKHITINDDNGNGRIGKGDSIVGEEKNAFKKYRKTAQTIITQFRQNLPNEIKLAAEKLKGAKKITTIRLPGQQEALPSMRTIDDFYATDFNSDGKTDDVIFFSTNGVRIQIQMPCYDNPQLAEKCDIKAVEGYLKLFDVK